MLNKVAGLRDTYFEEYLWITVSLCNEILLEKIRAVFHIQIKLDVKKDWLEKDTISALHK